MRGSNNYEIQMGLYQNHFRLIKDLPGRGWLRQAGAASQRLAQDERVSQGRLQARRHGSLSLGPNAPIPKRQQYHVREHLSERALAQAFKRE
jgi:hypothetical protein